MATETKKFKKRLFRVSKELNVTVDTLREHLAATGFDDALAGSGLNAAITNEEAYDELQEEFAQDKASRDRIRKKRASRQAALIDVVEAAETSVEEPSLTGEVNAPVLEAKEETLAEVPEPEAVDSSETTMEAEPPAPVEPLEEEKIEVPEANTPAQELAPAKVADQEAETIPSPEPEQEVSPVEVEDQVPVSQPVDQAREVAQAEPEEVGVDNTPDSLEDALSGFDEVTPDAVEAPIEANGDAEENIIVADRYKLAGTKVLGKIDLSAVESEGPKRKRKRKRKRHVGDAETSQKPVVAKQVKDNKESSRKRKKKRGPVVDEADVEQTLQQTLKELEQGASRVRQRRRKARRDERAAVRQREMEDEMAQEKVLRVTEFVSTGELANLMDVPVNEVIGSLFGLGMMVSINQRLDADTISILASDYGFEVEFITELSGEDILIDEDDPEDLVPRAPVVTVMGHVDHGKTSLLDYIRKSDVVAGEAGGITQHIGAHRIKLPDGRVITFLDTPGHEAFTAMRARGAQVTDIVILVVAADDAVMPQTVEAINHARAAEVPIVVAVNKIDRPDANTQKVMQQLTEQNVLVEQYGGKVQCALVSAKTGKGISDLIDKVLLEAEMLNLAANPDRNAVGTVIESRMEKGRGNVATVLVQNGTLRVGDAFVVGTYSGRVRAMFDERDQRMDEVGPARPSLVLGLVGAPEVGDQFVVLNEEREAKQIAQKREQIFREQALRQRKHITLDEIGRRLALGDFRELNLIIKADVGGSVEALSDSLLKLSTEEVAVNIIHRGVGAITETDVMLASASDAVIIGFQVRPIPGARMLAEREELDIRSYSIIYDAIQEVHDALEGMLSPDKTEKITGTVEVREIFKVPKVGTIAGCYVVAGAIKRNDRVRLIREGVVIYEGNLSSLKRFKDDVREVLKDFECGVGMENYNDIKVGDQLESFVIIETARKLED